MKRSARQIFFWLCAAVLCTAAFPAAARAQDFYGEGNVLIAVDMGAYAENENVSYREGTLGALQWGADAPTGVSTRPAFNNHVYSVSPDVTPVAAPDYAIETVYTVGQKVFFPYLRYDDPQYKGLDWLTADVFPSEVFENGTPRFLIHRDGVKTENGGAYYISYEKTEDGAIHPCADFLEIECVAVTEHSTIWQYTGIAYSNRTGFDPADYVDAVELSDAEVQFFRDTCDEAYIVESRIYGDPRFEDMRGDRDGKAAYVALDLSVLSENTAAYYRETNTSRFGFDCLIIGVNGLPERKTDIIRKKTTEEAFIGTLIHELNHYIVGGCIGHESEKWNMWVGEAFAQSAIYAVKPESIAYSEFCGRVTSDSSRLRQIPGMLWNYGGSEGYPNFKEMSYVLGQYFLRYIERETTGQADGRLWTNYFAQRTPVGSITGTELDRYLTETTGEGLDAWMARFMAAVVVGDDSGAYCMGEETATAKHRVDPYMFFRPYEEYGTGLAFTDAVDDVIVTRMENKYYINAVRGGGTTYAWRNDAGGRIAITGADDDWYFFAVSMELPGEREVIDISSAEQLAKIGNDPDYLPGGRYRLTADLDLGGAQNPWLPIGTYQEPFTGEFDGNGHTIRGLYINAPRGRDQALFGEISGNAEIHDLSVYGSVTARKMTGGVVGYLYGGTVRDCTCGVTVTGIENVGGFVGYHYLGKLKNCTATGAVTADNEVGGVAGYGSWATVENCRAAGTVTGDRDVGGVVGFNDGCTVSECSQSGSVSGTTLCGGIVGFVSQYGTIQNCRAAGTVRGVSYVGGIVGEIQINSAMQNCYNVATVSGESHVGGVAGRIAYAEMEHCYSYQSGLPVVGSIHANENGETATLTACYARSDTETGAGYLTTAQFARQNSFDGWDFDAVWTLANGVRPMLRSNPEQLPARRGGGGGSSGAAAAQTEQAPSSETTVPPITTAELLERFDDLAPDAWYLEPIRYVVERGIMNGVGDGGFDPDAATTTGMVAQMLMNLAGESASPDTAAEAYSDVDAADWFAPAISWLTESSIARGEGDAFGASEPISRERTVALLYNFARHLGCDTSARGDLSAFSDAAGVSDWARDAMEWALAVGLIKGATDESGNVVLDAQATATRGQIAAIAQRFCENVMK